MKAFFKKYKTYFLIAIIVLLCGGAFCGYKTVEKINEPTTIGICLPNFVQKRWEQDAKNLAEKLEMKNYKTIIEFADDDVYKQREQIESMIKQGVDVLLITPVKDDSLSDLVKKAKDKGIYVVAYDRMITNTELVDYYVTFEIYNVGILQANFIVEKLGLLDENNKNTYNIEIFAGDPLDYNATFYYKGAMAVLKRYIDDGRIVIPSKEITFEQCSTDSWSARIAQSRLATMLDKCYQDKQLHAVLCQNDGLAMGVYEGLMKKGYENKMPVLTGQDAETDFVKVLKNKDTMMTVFKDTRVLAEETVMLIDDLMNGKVPKINNATDYNNGRKRVNSYESKVIRVDKSNYKSILIDSGYITEENLN